MRPSDLIQVDWELGLFRALRALWRALAPAPPLPYDPERAALAEPLIARLTALGRLLSGEPIEVAVGEGGSVRGRVLMVPAYIDLGPNTEVNADLYALRVCVAATQRRLGQPPSTSLGAELRGVAEAVELLRGELGGFEAAWSAACGLALAARPALDSLNGLALSQELARQALLRGEPLPGVGQPGVGQPGVGQPTVDQPGVGQPAVGSPVPLWGPVRADPNAAAGALPEDATRPASGSEAEAPPIDELRIVALDPKKQAEQVLQHSFEKVETLDEHRGQVRQDDGSDELHDHLEAIQELKLQDMVRGGAQAHSVLRAPVALEVDVSDVGRVELAGLPYDEWDHRRQAYRKGWCTVLPGLVSGGDPAWVTRTRARYRATIEELYARLLARATRRAPQPRQAEGEEVDLDALVEHIAEVRAGRTGDGRVYIRQQRRDRELFTTVLLDVSLSTDAWVADRRVLDVTRESAFVLGEVLHRLNEPLEILSFSSQTRNACAVHTVKRFDEPWPRAAARLGALSPQGYTRIGPAIRHATAGLASRSGRRLLLLITDGKPTDYDRYEGRYGLADVRQALREAEAAGVVTHALAIDPAARALLPAMMGPGASTVLPSPERLPLTMVEVHARMSVR